jgi:DNA-binding CsgD family transcriptional regulator
VATTSRGGPGDVFVGRQAELSALAAALEEARAGRPQFVVVEGAEGMGKSALLRRFLADAPLAVVLSAAGEEDEVPLAWGVLRQLVASAGRALAPSFGALADGPPPGADPLAVGANILDALGALQEHGPVGVVVDDVHWVDLPSIRALAFACRRLVADRVLVVATLRPEESGRLDERWSRLTRSGGATHLHLPGLAQDELDELARALGKALPPWGARRLWEHTGGHPLHARALVRELSSEVLHRPGATLPAPRSLAAAVLRRLGRCTPGAQALIAAAAVLGQRASLRRAIGVAGLMDPADAVNEAVGAGLLVEVAGSEGRELAFPHNLVRTAVYDDLGPARRRLLHARAGELSGGRASLEHRLAAAVGPDGALASELEELASLEAARGALSEAGRHLLLAASVSAPGSDHERRVLNGIEAHLRVADVASAEAARSELEALPSSPRRSAVAGSLAYLGGRGAEAQALLTDAWTRLGPGRAPSGLAAAIAARLCRLAIVDHRLDEMVAWGERARAGASDPEVAAAALCVHSLALALVGRAPEALAQLEPLGAAETVDTALIDGVVMRGVIRLWTDDLAGARADLSAALARARAGEPVRFVGQAAGYLSEACYRAGELGQSVVCAEIACAMAVEAGRDFDLPFVHALAAYPHAARGELAEARTHVEAALAASRTLGLNGAVYYAAAAAAALAQAEGDVAALAVAADRHSDSPELGVYPIGPIRAEVHLAQGRLQEADATLRAYEARADLSGRASAGLAAARVRVELEAARGNADTARAAFAAGLALASRLERPLEVARLRLSFGAALGRFGRRREARALLATAIEGFAAIGAGQYLARAEAALLDLGAPWPLEPTALTPQESAVASLVAAGLTNKEVASRLVLSPKTVEYHLGNIFAKLGVSSRTELAIRLARDRTAV